MTLLQVLNNVSPGTIITHGSSDDPLSYVEIFVLKDMSLRFSDPNMEINEELLHSEKWEK